MFLCFFFLYEPQQRIKNMNLVLQTCSSFSVPTPDRQLINSLKGRQTEGNAETWEDVLPTCMCACKREYTYKGGGVIAARDFTKRLVVNQLRDRGGAGERIVFGLMLVVLICNFSSVWAQRKKKPIRKQRQTTFQPIMPFDLFFSPFSCLSLSLSLC